MSAGFRRLSITAGLLLLALVHGLGLVWLQNFSFEIAGAVLAAEIAAAAIFIR